jgi:hypothetical protein
MTLTLNLPPELEQRLLQQAEEQGVPADQYALQLLAKHLPAQNRKEELIALLQSWIDGDNSDQRETGNYLVQAIDEDRLSDRRLFPPELEGVTW